MMIVVRKEERVEATLIKSTPLTTGPNEILQRDGNALDQTQSLMREREKMLTGKIGGVGLKLR